MFLKINHSLYIVICRCFVIIIDMINNNSIGGGIYFYHALLGGTLISVTHDDKSGDNTQNKYAEEIINALCESQS